MKETITLFLKGLAMGAADVVPGVSGGTIAFISGIYERLLNAISNINLSLFQKLFKGQFLEIWKQLDGKFLLPLFIGIIVSIVTLAKGITFLLDTYPVLVWSFFFGLIISSAWLVGKQVEKWNFSAIASAITGAIIAYFITELPPMEQADASWYIFLSGAIAICAMILPGISGSFILLLLGSYATVLGAVKEMKISIIALFAGGCITGLLLFSKVLNWAFKNFPNIIIAVLTGFLIGSLNKIWPWKITLNTRINSHGEEVPFIQENCLPTNYIDGDHQLSMAIVCLVIGLASIVLLEIVANKMKKD